LCVWKVHKNQFLHMKRQRKNWQRRQNKTTVTTTTINTATATKSRI